jgi:DNA-binding transcriptional regulator YdaS (Cro superfamily)
VCVCLSIESARVLSIGFARALPIRPARAASIDRACKGSVSRADLIKSARGLPVRALEDPGCLEDGGLF